MKKTSSFNVYRVECPVCRTANTFKGIKPKAYLETSRDTDFGPAVRDCQDPRHQVKNPLLYFMGTCKKCYFTHELNKEFIEWENGLEFRSRAFETSRTRHLQELKKKNGFIMSMGKNLRPSKDPFASSVIKFLLGIYDESLKPDPSSYNLGRYYLRVAWIFREERQKEKSAWIKENLTIQSLGEALESIQSQHADYLQKVQKLKGLVEFEFASEAGSKNEDIRNRCNLLVDQIIRKLNSVKNATDELQSLHRENQHKPLAQSGNNLLGLEEFLFGLKMDWPWVPTNEKEALELSLENYKKSLTQGLKGNQMIQIPYLIGELSRRIGDLDTAKEYFDLTIDVGKGFMEENREDELKTALVQKILEMAHQQKEVMLKRKEEMG
jgi:uncharacterized protein (DUF2225 family)